MPLPTLGEIWFWVFTAICAGAGAYFAPYLRKRAENLATHEDLDKLVVQMEATTKATKAIEARISNEVWDRQRQWEMKRDAALEAYKTLGRYDDALLEYSSVEQAEIANAEEAMRLRGEALHVVREASREWDRARHVVSVLGSKRLNLALGQANLTIRRNSHAVIHGEVKQYVTDVLPEVQQRLADVIAATREELGLIELLHE